jgi:GT2 family glycosyltransferase
VTPISDHKTVTAIIVTFNSEENIIDSLKAIKREIDAVGGEIIIIDNNSGDNTVSLIRSSLGTVDVIESPKNIGFGRANNKVAFNASGKYLLLVNPDLILDKGALTELIEHYQELPDCGAAVPRLRHPDGNFQPSCRRFPTSANIFFSRGSFLSRIFGGERSYTLPDYEQATAVPAAAATCLLIERELYKSVDGFDPRYFMFMEDTDLCRKLSLAGKKVYFIPRAGAVHRWGTGAAVSRAKRLFYQHRSVWQYFLKHYPNGFSLFLLPLVLSINFTLMLLLGMRK